jgi:hypothetical protein
MILYKLIGYNPATDTYTNPNTGQVENIPSDPYITSTVSPGATYEDISSITNWYNYDGLDWGRRRTYIKPLFYASVGPNFQNYANLTQEEKLIGGLCFFSPYALRIQLWSDEEDKQVWMNVITETKRTRMRTVEAMRKNIAEDIRVGTLTLLQTQMFDKDTSDMIAWYERSDARDFYQWLTNEVGSPYENDGYAQTSYYIVALRDSLVSIYNGNF